MTKVNFIASAKRHFQDAELLEQNHRPAALTILAYRLATSGKNVLLIDLDLESPKPLTQNNLTVCEILRGPVGCSTKDMVCWFKGTTHRAIMDNFCKATARRHSLEGALWDMKAFETLGEEQGIKGGRSHEDNVAFRSLVNKFRFAAWNTYNNRKNHEVAKV